MKTAQTPHWTEILPDPLPPNPLQVAAAWLAQAQIDAAQPNPNAMVLATVDTRGQPSARVVLCKEIAPEPGYIAFYTNYESRKGRELEGNPRAAVVFHWDHRHRQVRAEGTVEKLSDADSDAYFESRAWQSRLGA
jgi:pyridoxamine 5'-phosphate oxidase